MKSFFSFLLFSIPFIISAQIPSAESKRTFYGVKIDTSISAIYKIRYEYYLVRNDSLFLREIRSKQDHYYGSGLISKIDLYKSNSYNIDKSFEFDSLERIVEERSFGEGRRNPLIVYEYRDTELIAVVTAFNKDSSINLWNILYYDKDFKNIKRELYKGDSLLRSYWIFDFDTHGKLISNRYINTPNGSGMTGFDGKFIPWSNSSFTYDIKYNPQNEPVQITEYLDSEIVSKSLYSNIGDTLVEQKNKYKPENIISSTEITKTIDSLKIITKKSYGMDFYSRKEYVNDKLIYSKYLSEKYNTSSNYTYRYEYDYDYHGNWIEEKVFRNGLLHTLTKRIIEYE